jgi:hypothetical protein
VSRGLTAKVSVPPVINDPILTAIEDPDAAETRREALGYVTEAFAEAILAGIESDSFAHAAIFAAFQELVVSYGEDHVVAFAKTLPDRIASGEFSIAIRH